MAEGTIAGADLDALLSLVDPVRRGLYAFVAAAGEAVSRNTAAAGVGVGRQVAAYHLDRLAEDGLLDVEFRRLSGRTGPGAGRPSKLYRRSTRSFEFSIPPRRYELAARIMLEAVGQGEATIDEVAHRVGTELGRSGLDDALTVTGYEHDVEGTETRFRNCPFHALREQDRDTICHMNLALVEGMIHGVGAGAKAVLAPEEGYCCVRLRPA